MAIDRSATAAEYLALIGGAKHYDCSACTRGKHSLCRGTLFGLPCDCPACHPPAQSKYHNVRVRTDEGTFDSKHEHKRWGELQLLERTGEIMRGSLRRQVKYDIEVNGVWITSYRADFVYRTPEGHEVIEDAKGVRTRDFAIKKNLMYAVHGIAIVEV